MNDNKLVLKVLIGGDVTEEECYDLARVAYKAVANAILSDNDMVNTIFPMGYSWDEEDENG